jgi:hypothetical protein
MSSAETADTMRTELVALLRDHPGGGLLREPTTWKDTLRVVEAHLANRKQDIDFRGDLRSILGQLLPDGVFFDDNDLLRVIQRLVTSYIAHPQE